MKKPHAFITGITGFAGSYLAEELLNNGYQVSGSVYPGESTKNIEQIKKHLKLFTLDVLNYKKCCRTIIKLNPEYIFHLAAFSSVGQSFNNERLTYQVNFDGTLNILQAAVKLGKLNKLIFISTSECYGRFKPNNKTLTETQPFNPISPYAISKVAAEYVCLFYFNRFKLPVTIARSFNHSGPRQNENFVIPSFAKQIATIEKKKSKPIMFVGDLSVKRDLSDVRDIVYGYRLLAEKGKPGRAYNLSSGKAVSIKSVLNHLLQLSKINITVKTDKARLRKNEIPVLRGNNSCAIKELGYKNRYRLNTTLKDTLDYWRKELNT